MVAANKVFTFLTALSFTLWFAPQVYAADSNCEFQVLLDVAQRRFNARVLNAIARHEAGQRSQLSTPRGKKATAFEDAVLEACRLNPQNPKLAAEKLGQLLDIPSEVAEVAIAFYDLEDIFRNDPSLREKVRSQITEFFPLPDIAPRVPVNGQAIADTWSIALSRHSPAKDSFDHWRKGEASSTERNANEDDGLWWKSILTSVKTIEASQAKHPTPEIEEFLKQESGRLWQLYGALVERSLLKAQEGDIIPGTAITVGGKAHADGWKVSYTKIDGSPKLLIEGFLESKSSFLGVMKAQDQIRGFLTRMIENPNRIFIFGEYIDPKSIYLNTSQGPISLSQFARENSAWVKGESVDAEFAEKFKEYFQDDFYQVALPKGEPAPPLPVGKYAVTQTSRSELQNQFARLIHKRFRPKSEDPNLIKERLFSEAGAAAPLPPEWQHYRNFRGSGATSRIVSIDDWMHPETGGLAAIKALPSYSKKLDESLADLSAHLPEATRRRLESEFRVGKKDGNTALSSTRPNRDAAERIRKRLEAFIQAHNAWAAESPTTRANIPLERLSTKEGMAKALQTLTYHAQSARLALARASETIPFDDFIHPETGGLTAIKALPNYSNKLNESLADLSAHLPEATRRRLESEFRVGKSDGITALHSTPPYRSSAERIRNRLEALIQAHNEWAAESPTTRANIPLERLSTKEGMAKALQTLAASANPSKIPFDDFIHPETGGLTAIKALPNYSNKLDELLAGLAVHLPEVTRRRLESEFPVAKVDGTRALQSTRPNRDAKERIRNHLEALIQAHNAWAAESPTTRTTIPLEGLATKEGMAKALQMLTDYAQSARLALARATETIPFDDFINPETGGLNAIKALPSYSKKLDESLADLSAHLPEATRRRLESEYSVGRDEGAKALSSTQPVRIAAERIRNHLEALIQAHNAWAAESPTTRTAIPIEELATKEGMAKALQTLTYHAQSARLALARASETIPFDDFIHPETGGLTAIKALPNYSNKLDESLAGLAAHLPEATRGRLENEYRVAKNDGAGALSSTQPNRIAAERIRNHLEALIQAHNAWAAESPTTRTAIPLERLATKEGMAKALQTLAASANSSQIPFDDFINPETGGLASIKSIPNYSTKLDESLADLSAHLPEATRRRLESEYPVGKADGARALSSTRPNRDAKERIRNHLEALIQAHNAWAAELPTTRTAIPLEGLATKEGMAKALQTLAASANSSKISFDDFINPETGGLTAIKALPNYSTKLDEALADLSAHLPEATRRRLEREFSVAKRDGNTALSSTQPNRIAAERIRNHLEALIQAHNAWAAESPTTRTAIPLEGLATKQGMQRAIEILKAASQ